MNPTRCQRDPRSRLRTFAALLIALAAGACASGPYQAKLMVQGSPKLNPTLDGHPSAVNIRVFPLKDKDGFANAKEEALLAEQPGLPPESWIPPHKEAVVYVGQTNEVEIEVKPEVHFLGVFGLFNENSGTSRLVLDVADLGSKMLRFDAYSLEVTERPKAAPAPAAKPDEAPKADAPKGGDGKP